MTRQSRCSQSTGALAQLLKSSQRRSLGRPRVVHSSTAAGDVWQGAVSRSSALAARGAVMDLVVGGRAGHQMTAGQQTTPHVVSWHEYTASLCAVRNKPRTPLLIEESMNKPSELHANSNVLRTIEYFSVFQSLRDIIIAPL